MRHKLAPGEAGAQILSVTDIAKEGCAVMEPPCASGTPIRSSGLLIFIKVNERASEGYQVEIGCPCQSSRFMTQGWLTSEMPYRLAVMFLMSVSESRTTSFFNWLFSLLRLFSVCSNCSSESPLLNR